MERAIKQTGFAVVEALLIFVIIGIIGGTSWYVWKTQKSAKQSNNATQPISNTQTKPVPSNNNQTPESMQKYLDIKEWGVKLKLSEKSTGVYYVVKDGSTIWLFDKNFDEQKNSNGTQCKDDTFPPYVIIRNRGSKTENIDTAISMQIKVSDYVYTGTVSNGAAPKCASVSSAGEKFQEDTNISTAWASTRMMLRDLFGTLQAD